MALRGAGKRAISAGISGRFSGAPALLEFKQGNVSGRRVSAYAASYGRLPEPWRTKLRQDNDGHGLYVVYSYATPIAWRRLDLDASDVATEAEAWTIPDVHYSVTTTQHQNVVRTEITDPGHYRDTQW